ncbi:hypothetical protein BIW11_12648 [Tropilaelaps mercedesae]|uniref:Uncharacterized protein n=1 Tax=Tropilaelaps mercedesae TaxID=418985 RepID=A0A1V9X5H3_9ACAR|nr:hypothetical protein BIW11_12648 [Tropilaelaps mercedesae]
MTGLSAQPFIPAGSRHSHHVSAKTSKKMPSALSEEERRKITDRGDRAFGSTSDYLATSSKRTAAHSSDLAGNLRDSTVSSSGCSLDMGSMAQAQDRLQLISCEADNMSTKLKSVQEVLDTAREDLSQLRSLVSRLERLGGSKNVENADLKCTLLRTHIEGLSESVKTMPHFYPSKTMFVEAIMALKEALSCHDYVNAIDNEKSQLLRDQEKLRNEMRLITDENEKLKRKHHKDKKMISELMERLGSSAKFPQERHAVLHGSPTMHTCGQHSIGVLGSGTGLTSQHSQSHGKGHPANQILQSSSISLNHREEDLKLIELLRQVKALLQSGGKDAERSGKGGPDENDSSSSNQHYENLLKRLREAMQTGRSLDSQRPSQQDDVTAMDSYCRIFEKNISFIEKELNTKNRITDGDINANGGGKVA